MTLDPEEHPTSGPVIRDKRRIDPETGEMRERQETAAPAAGPDGSAPPPVAEAALVAARAELAERTVDLQRVQAEYLNYKRRVDRDRENARRNAIASTVSALLPVLDDIARAREHDELTGGFKAVAESFERAMSKLGVTTFGEVGDEFDPRIHEALMHSYSDEVSGPTCQAILQVGYRIDDRIIRPARVAVAEPSGPADMSAESDDDGFEMVLEDDASGGPSYGDNERETGDEPSDKDA